MTKNLSFPSSYALPFWICLFLATRLYTLYFGLGFAWTNEEYFRGTIAKEFLGFFHGHALRLPLWEFQADSYLGGTLLVGLITAINYSVFGVSLLSLKLTAVYFGLGALVLMFSWLRREIGASAANAFAFFYVLASPGFISLGLIAMGYHTESILFFAGTFILGHRISRNPQRGLHYLAFGVLSGFAFWFSFINGITSGAVVLSLARTAKVEKHSWPRIAFLFSLGLAIGLCPWIYFNASSHWSGWIALTKDFMLPEGTVYYSGHGFFYWKAKKLFLLAAKDIAYFQRFSRLPVSYVFLGLLLFLATGFNRKRDRFVSVFFMAYSALFVASYAVTNRMIFLNEEVVSHRYLMSLFFMLIMAISIQHNYRSVKFFLSAAAVGLMALMGLYEHFDSYTPIHRFSPSSLITLSEKLNSDNFTREDLPEFLRLARTYPEDQQLYFLAGLKNFDFDGGSRLSDGSLRKALLSLKPAERNLLLRRMGGIYSDSKLPPPPARDFPGSSSDLRQFLYGYVQSSVAWDRDPKDKVRDWDEELSHWRALSVGFWKTANNCGIQPKEDDPWLVRGIGAGIRSCEPSLHMAFRRIASLHSPESLGFYAWGIGWDLRERLLEDPYRSLIQIHTLPQEYQTQALEGAVSFEQFFGIPSTESILKLRERPE